jgi:hypothetical protein
MEKEVCQKHCHPNTCHDIAAIPKNKYIRKKKARKCCVGYVMLYVAEEDLMT